MLTPTENSPSTTTSSLLTQPDRESAISLHSNALQSVNAHPLQIKIAQRLSDSILSGENSPRAVRALIGVSKLLSALPGFGPADAVVNASHEGDDLTLLHRVAMTTGDHVGALADQLLSASAAKDGAVATPVWVFGESRTAVTPAHIAGWYRNTGVWGALVRHRADFNCVDSSGATPVRLLLEHDADSRAFALAEELYRQGIPLDTCDVKGISTLSSAIARGDWITADFVLRHGGRLSRLESLEYQRVREVMVQQVRELVEGRFWNELGSLLDIWREHREELGTQFLQDLLNDRQNVEDLTFVQRCILYGAAESTITCLLDLGANPHAKCSATIYGVEGKELRTGVMAIHLAAAVGRISVVDRLLERGADLSLPDGSGENTLFYAFNRVTPTVRSNGVRENSMKARDQLEARLKLIDRLLEADAPVTTLNLQGRSLSDLSVVGEFWEALGRIERAGGRVSSLSPEELTRAQSLLRYDLKEITVGQQWGILKNCLEALGEVHSFADSGIIPQIFNDAGESGLGNPLTLTMCSCGTPGALLEKVDELGGDFSIRGGRTFEPLQLFTTAQSDELKLKPDEWSLGLTREQFPGPSLRALQVTLLHAAASSGNPQTMKWAIHHAQMRGISIDSRDSFGNPATFYAQIFAPHANRALIHKILFDAGISPWAANHRGVVLYGIMASTLHLQAADAVIDDYLSVIPKDPAIVPHWFRTLKDAEPSHIRAVQREFIEVLRGTSREIRDEALSLLMITRNLEYALNLAKGATEAGYIHKFKDGSYLSRLIPGIMTGAIPSRALGGVAHRIDYSMPLSSLIYERGGFHPNLAELFAAMLDPKDPRGEGAMINILTSSVTRTTRLVNQMGSVSSEMRFNLGWFALRGFSFSAFKHDARSPAASTQQFGPRLPSILERIGFTAIRENSNGPAFILRGSDHPITFYSDDGKTARTLSDEAVIILTQAYTIYSSPPHGAVFIRNNSEEAERDKISFPIYWSRYAVGQRADLLVEDLLALSDKTMPLSFKQVLSPTINRPEQLLHEKLSSLRKELRGVFEWYHARKFDTRADFAWEYRSIESEDEVPMPPILTGGFLSNGFTYVVEYLEALEARGLPLPSLAFIHPDYSPWNRFSYLVRGETTYELKCTTEVIKTLRHLVDHRGLTVTNDVEESVWAFIKCGMDRSGSQLVIVDEKSI